MYIYDISNLRVNISYACRWNKKKRFTARMYGVGSFKIRHGILV